MLGLKAQVRLRALGKSSTESLESARLTASLTPRAWSVVTLRCSSGPPDPQTVIPDFWHSCCHSICPCAVITRAVTSCRDPPVAPLRGGVENMSCLHPRWSGAASVAQRRCRRARARLCLQFLRPPPRRQRGSRRGRHCWGGRRQPRGMGRSGGGAVGGGGGGARGGATGRAEGGKSGGAPPPPVRGSRRGRGASRPTGRQRRRSRARGGRAPRDRRRVSRLRRPCAGACRRRRRARCPRRYLPPRSPAAAAGAATRAAYR